jgi:hypothetical protein
MDASEIILKFANNLLNQPENQKYRSIRIGNKIFQSRLLPVMGGVECLFAVGFEEVSCCVRVILSVQDVAGYLFNKILLIYTGMVTTLLKMQV